MADREEGTAAPNQRQGQNQQQNQQQQNQDAAGQQHLHINWSNFKPEFSVSNFKPEKILSETRRRCRGTSTMLQ